MQNHALNQPISWRVLASPNTQATFAGKWPLSHPSRTPLATRCAKSRAMWIKTIGDYQWRTDLYDSVGDRLGENTRSGAVDGACEFTREMLGNLERAVEHPDMTENLAEFFSTRTVDVEYLVKTSIRID